MKKILLLFFINVLVFVNSETFDAKVIRVSDGDTIVVILVDKKIKIRLYGIDAPEKNQDYGNKATKNLSRYVLNRVVEIDEKAVDRYGRLVAVIYFEGENINLKMLFDGLAWAYIQYLNKNDKAEYINAERQAKEEKRGLWEDNNTIPPWKFRKIQKEKKRNKKNGFTK